MNKAHFSSIALFVMSFFLMAFVQNHAALMGDLDMRLQVFLGEILSWFQMEDAPTESTAGKPGFIIDGRTAMQFWLLVSAFLAALSGLISLIHRLRYGANNLFPALFIMGGVLSAVAIKTGYTIGVFMYA